MVSGAGSVAVSARPILPNTVSTSGTVLISRSVVCSSWRASPMEMPGLVVGMYIQSPSSSGGMNSLPSWLAGHSALAASSALAMMVSSG